MAAERSFEFEFEDEMPTQLTHMKLALLPPLPEPDEVNAPPPQLARPSRAKPSGVYRTIMRDGVPHVEWWDGQAWQAEVTG